MDVLARRLGKMDAVLHRFANGRVNSPVQRTDHIPNNKSVGTSATTPRNLVDDEDIHLMLFFLAARMRELASRCTVVEVSVRDVELRSFSRRQKLRNPTCSSEEIAEVAVDLFCKNYQWEKPVRSINVRGSALVEAEAGTQLSLYQDDIKRDKWERIDAAVDSLRGRYGYMSIRRAVTCTDSQLGAINP